MIVKQLLVGPMAVFAYIVACEKTGQALVIDPGAEADRIAKEAQELDLTISHIINTHAHWDHTSDNDRLRELTGAQIVSRDDPRLDQDREFRVGEVVLEVFHTPGHSPDGICLYADGQLFTGDTLFVGDSGRTDLAGGHRPTLGASIRRLMELPDRTVVWPGHHYGPTPSSTLAWEKRHNVNAREYGYYSGD
ncbi:MAG: MBL fold metallo-hydrolase [Proteobacteria bacterium]|nr:MBL fold metallo-hydrolase [Pseudomonadota bacterium]